MDQGAFSEPLNTPRRTINIDSKLKVVQFYLKLLKEKKAAEEFLQEPRVIGMSQGERKEWREKRQTAKQKRKINLQKECQQKFPETVGKSSVRKWVKKAKHEGLGQMPETLRCRMVATNNSWRKKFGLPPKGRPQGGRFPLSLQKELDVLMVELTSGSSVISERREIVTDECIATCWQF